MRLKINAVLTLSALMFLAAPVLAADATQSAPAASATATSATAPSMSAAPDRSEWAVDAGTTSVKSVIGSLNKADGYLFQAELITEGASIYTVKLTNYFGTVNDDRLYEKVDGNEAAYEESAAKDPQKYHGHYSLLNPLPNGMLPLQTLSVWVGDLKFNVGTRQWKISPQPSSQPADGQSLEMTWTLLRDANLGDGSKPADYKPYLRLTKIYTLRKNTYSLAVGLKVENLSGEKVTVAIQQAGPTGVPEEPQQTPDLREVAYGKWNFADQKVDPFRKKVNELDKFTLDQPVNVGSSQEGIVWAGQTNKYFGAMLYLQNPADKPVNPVPVALRAEWYLLPVRETHESRTWATGLKIPDLALEAGTSRTLEFDLFAGPKQRDMLQDEMPPGKPLYKELNYRSIIDLSGSCAWCTFDALTFVMMWLLEKFAWLSIGNYGVAIILLVVLVRVLLHPLTKKSQVSMMKMQKLAPEMAKIKEKYANDKEALNREMMAIYKKQGPASMLGCLPMFLQMPIWIALWTALSNSVELRHAAFLPIWITDLSAPDRLISFSTPLVVPFIGWKIYGLNLLPLLLTVAMFLQTKLTPTQVATTPEAQKQQKMMLYMMPAMMLFIFYAQPSGLNLYIMASTFAGVGEQYVIRKHIRQKEAQESAQQQMVDMPGRGPRGKRTRKPKGPFWTKQ